MSAGLLSIVTNFNQNKDAVSGPLAIVAAGADIARNDAASLMQFAAIVNVNLAMVNALPLPVSLFGHPYRLRAAEGTCLMRETGVCILTSKHLNSTPPHFLLSRVQIALLLRIDATGTPAPVL